VTGVDDQVDDGDIAYTASRSVRLQAPIPSTPRSIRADVAVTNADDDAVAST
jgi:hypothetical protein